jgi:hypothetical protein
LSASRSTANAHVDLEVEEKLTVKVGNNGESK